VTNKAFSRHSRVFEDNQLVYPVLSRRSRGISIGINLNPAKDCNYDCVYCQVDRVYPLSRPAPIDPAILQAELSTMAQAVRDGTLADHPRFQGADPAMLTVKDIAFSGDGEPTLCHNFADMIKIAAKMRRQIEKGQGSPVQLVLITNGTTLDTPAVKGHVNSLLENEGEVWIKLDAVTASDFARIYDCQLSFSRTMRGIRSFARHHPVTLQTMVFRWDDGTASLDPEVLADYLLEWLQSESPIIRHQQLYTLARNPREGNLKALGPIELASIKATLGRAVPWPISTYA